ncbi:hypothetical protein Q8F55_001680 [Vanrija albida]|uniref:Uncharacterized protein n=1 Tax=Vanrija albida TaxID=181172 RepID=A0ABR3Q7M0_9TREE
MAYSPLTRNLLKAMAARDAVSTAPFNTSPLRGASGPKECTCPKHKKTHSRSRSVNVATMTEVDAPVHQRRHSDTTALADYIWDMLQLHNEAPPASILQVVLQVSPREKLAKALAEQTVDIRNFCDRVKHLSLAVRHQFWIPSKSRAQWKEYIASLDAAVDCLRRGVNECHFNLCTLPQPLGPILFKKASFASYLRYDMQRAAEDLLVTRNDLVIRMKEIIWEAMDCLSKEEQKQKLARRVTWADPLAT